MCFFIIIFIIIYQICKDKEGYKRHKRSGIRSGWRRRGNAAKNIALKGTRWHKLPSIDSYYNSGTYISYI